jgi:hypothetical protein
MACPVVLSNYLVTALVNLLTNQGTYTSPATLYAALYTASPGQGNTGPEVSTVGTGYTRQPVTWSSVVSNQSTNTEVITFPLATSNWGTINFVALFDAASGGNLLAFAPATISINITTGSVFQINIGDLVLGFQ